MGFQGSRIWGQIPSLLGEIAPLEWTYYNTAGMGVTNLNYCSVRTQLREVCTAPWPNLGTVTSTVRVVLRGAPSSPAPIGGGPLMATMVGNYTFDWQTSRNSGWLCERCGHI